MDIRDIKLRNLTRLIDFQRELPGKYKNEEIAELIQKLIRKTYNLRYDNIIDYVATISYSGRSYPELLELLPTREEMEEFRKMLAERPKRRKKSKASNAVTGPPSS